MSSGGGPTDRSALLPDALRAVTAAVASAPKVALLLVLMGTGVSVGLTLCYLGFRSQRADLLDPRTEHQRHWREYVDRFGDRSDLIVTVGSDDPRAVRDGVDAVAQRLRAEPELFTAVLHRIDGRSLRRKGLQAMPPADLARALRRVEVFASTVTGRWDHLRLDTLVRSLETQVPRSGGAAAQATRLVDSLAAFEKNPDAFRSPWLPFTAAGEELDFDSSRPTYFENDAGTLAYLTVRPVSVAKPGAAVVDPGTAIERLRTIAAEVAAGRDGAGRTIEVGVTGVPVLEYDEMRRGRRDMMKAGLLSFAAVGVLLVLGFRGVKHPALALFMLAVGLAWSFGFTTFTVGHLNILSVSFAVILIGLGIDFGIHYLARYLQYRRDGAGLDEALTETSAGVGVGIVTAAVTTALAFFCATFTNFLGVAELGIIAGGSILLCAAATFLVLPALVSLADRGVPASRLPSPLGFKWVRLGTSRFPTVAAVLAGGAAVGLAVQAVRFDGETVETRVRYDHNLLNLQAADAESIVVRERLAANGGPPLLYAVSLAPTAETARALAKRFEALPTVARVEHLAEKLPGDENERTRALIRRIRGKLAALRLPQAPPTIPPPSPKEFGLAALALEKTAAASDRSDLAQLAAKLAEFSRTFHQLGEGEGGGNLQAVLVDRYQQRIADDLLDQFRTLAEASSDLTPLTIRDVPAALRERFVGGEGEQARWLLQIYPKESVWDIDPLARFVADVRGVDPAVTGVPVQNYEAGLQIRDSYRRAALYALVVISLVLLTDFLAQENKLAVLFPPLLVVAFTSMTLLTKGIPVNPVYCACGYVAMVLVVAAILDFTNLRDALLALVPPVAGGAMMFGVMAVCGIHLNPANLIVLPLVLGIGVDDGVHVVHDFRSRGRDRDARRGHRGAYEPSGSTAGAIVLTSLTSMVGFGSLCVASHRGLFSVGLTLVIGIGCCLFVSLVLLPALLALLSREPKPERAAAAEEDADEEDDLEAATRPIRRKDRDRGEPREQRRKAA